MKSDTASEGDEGAEGSVLEVFFTFLKLGLTSFGGPIAHLGYFRAEFVDRRKWLDDRSYSDLVALCQFLPGPASRQVGMALGLGRAGWPGALAAWLGFTLPSAVALILFAFGVTQWAWLAHSGAVHGLKVVAVAVVAQAVWGMARSLCPDRLRAGLAVSSALLVLAVPGAFGQVAAILFGGLIGGLVIRLNELPSAQHRRYPVPRRVAAALLIVFAVLLVMLPARAATSQSVVLAAVAVVYKAGALVFGGGHVVLPLLQAGVVPLGWISNDAFLPAFLLVIGTLPFWEALRRRPQVQRSLAVINAAVVGVLAAALYDPLWTNALRSKADFGLALAAFGLLVYGRVPPVIVVIGTALGGWALAR